MLAKTIFQLTLYLCSTLENPTVGATHSSDSPTMDLAVQVLPALSSPTINKVIFLLLDPTYNIVFLVVLSLKNDFPRRSPWPL